MGYRSNHITLHSKITQAIGNVIHSFTDLNPLLMSILISVAFSLLMVTPISLVAIATAISLNGLEVEQQT